MSPEKTAETLMEEKLSIDCIEIEATQDHSNKPLIFKGPGEIFVENGILICKFYGISNKNNPLSEIIDSINALPGTLYSPSDYFTLNIKAMDGHRWVARQVIINPERSNVNPTNAVVRAKLSDLNHETMIPKLQENSISLTIVDQDESEWRALMGEWMAGAPYTGYKFIISSIRNSYIRVTVKSTSDFSEDIELRIIEALSFLLNDTLRVRTITRVYAKKKKTKLFSLSLYSKVRQRFSPLELRNQFNAYAARELLVRYMQFAGTAELPSLWHPCSAHLAHARQASNNSLDAWTVGICVALEGVATLFPCAVDPADKKVIQRVQKAASRWLRVFDVPKPIQDRVNGLLGQLTNIRVQDRVMPLVKSGLIEQDYVQAWTQARNKGVHTAKLNQDDFADPKLQMALTRIFKVQIFIYKLVFILIGYSGPYTDYGTIGFPQRNRM